MSAMHEFLLVLLSFAMVLALFASVVGVIAWALVKFVRSVAPFSRAEQDAKKSRVRSRTQWEPNHPHYWKRAGQ